MKTEKQQLGTKGEQLAAEFLANAGHKIITRNFRNGRSELDLISLEKDVLVISEVKSFLSAPLAVAEFRVDKAKQKMIIQGAYGFLDAHSEYSDYAVRFDVLIVDFSVYPAKINWHKEAFWQEEF